LFHPFGFGFEQISYELEVLGAERTTFWRQMRYLPVEYSTRVFAPQRKLPPPDELPIDCRDITTP
jgi:hypothetical protein